MHSLLLMHNNKKELVKIISLFSKVSHIFLPSSSSEKSDKGVCDDPELEAIILDACQSFSHDCGIRLQKNVIFEYIIIAQFTQIVVQSLKKRLFFINF